MKDESLVLKITAVAAVATAFTTFLLWLLPRLYQVGSFEEALSLPANGYYMSRLWVNFFHIPLALTAYFGLAYKLRNRELPKVALGFVWFVIWGIVEMIGVAIIIFSINRTWRNGYAMASDTQRELMKNNIEALLSVWDSIFFVLLVAFFLGTLLY